MRGPVTPHLLTLDMVGLFKLSILIEIQWYLIVVLIWVSLMSNNT
jgi:hypothetical protein